MLTYVLSADGSPLMPTYNIKKVRQMLQDGRAVIAGHKPGFTIRLTYELSKQDALHTQEIELCEDTGDHHIGLSVKSKGHEYTHAQCDRHARRIIKTHANDAYCMGQFRPRHKAHEVTYQKRRRNNRVLSKFYDAKYIDTRDGKKHPGKDLGCNRTDRSVPRNNDNNLRMYHGQKVSKGHCNIRRRHYPLQAGDVVMYQGTRRTVKGLHGNGTNVEFVPDRIIPKSAKTDRVIVIRYTSGWRLLSRLKPGVPAAL